MNRELIVIGAGPSGMMAAITAARSGKRVLLLEKLAAPGAKLKATGGGRCNFTNTLNQEDFMASFGREGRFMSAALNAMDYQSLVTFFKEIGVESHHPDGFHVFPKTHQASTIVNALREEMVRQKIEILTSTKVQRLLISASKIEGVRVGNHDYFSPAVILATGGLGYPKLGTEGDGHEMARDAGIQVTDLHPAMLPLHCRETWVKHCTADTIAKVEIRVNMAKHKKCKATGDLIFTPEGIRGPVVLNFARELTPLLAKYGEVPILLNFTKGMSENQIVQHFKKQREQNPQPSILQILTTLVPQSLAEEFCKLANVDGNLTYKKTPGEARATLFKLLAWTPLTITGHSGWRAAMVTRGGISLKSVKSETLESKKIRGLYLCGELLNLDGPCGGFNLQWAFASGHLAGQLR